MFEAKNMQRITLAKDNTEEQFIIEQNLLDIQLDSYERFLQLERIKNGEELLNEGLQSVFNSVFPIKSTKEDIVLEYAQYFLDVDKIKYNEYECKEKGASYSVPVRARITLLFEDTGEMRQKDVFMGDVPLMTERGTFIINGAERVVVSQIHRSPGVVFAYEKGVYSARIIPSRGSWLEFEIDPKKELIYAKIDSKKKILGTIFLRALGITLKKDIIDLFYTVKKVKLSKKKHEQEAYVNLILAEDIYLTEADDYVKLYHAGDKLHLYDVGELLQHNITSVKVIDLTDADSLNSEIIFNCLEREDAKFKSEGADEMTQEEALRTVYSIISPGESILLNTASEDFKMIFMNERRYELGKVGRYKLNQRLNLDPDNHSPVLSFEDIFLTMKRLIKVYIGEAQCDDIDHLENRRIRGVGELLTNAIKTAFSRLERIAKDRMNMKATDDMLRPQDLISIKPIISQIKEFFGSSQLSQFMDQVNPLAELTHKRRLNALGPGGLNRDRAGFEVRDVHYSHYGRMCPIETPEGLNIGLIISLSNYTRVNEYGFLEAPYRKVKDGQVTNEVVYLSATEEERYYIAQANAKLNSEKVFLDEYVSVRRAGDYTMVSVDKIDYIDLTPMQIVSVSTALIPFLEHDDANRALMGSNMQRQAVPLLFPEAPRVGTGMERKAAYDSGAIVKAKHSGVVHSVSSNEIVVQIDGADEDEAYERYQIQKFKRTNQDTCFLQRVIVKQGQHVTTGDVIADGPSTHNGELALGRNMLIGFISWNGYNFEDAILISEKVVMADAFTSIHIKELSIEVRDTKLGVEQVTRDIPNVSERALAHLDECGVVSIGAKVYPGSILVGKVSPKSESETTPEFKLLNQIFGEKARDVRDNSLRVPHGIEGTVIDVKRLTRRESSELSPGVEESVSITIAMKHRLREGDKMAGRHGNKGVIARVLPVEDMPYLEDGTPLDMCLNPLGIPSRMNIGQILETELGLAGVLLDEWYTTPVFNSASIEQIKEKLAEAGVVETAKVPVYDGQTGVCFENDVFVGVMYILKLHHLVDYKMHARSTGPYSLVTQQPLGGKAQFGGQRLGEMEVWALEAYGAANMLQELLTIKSDDMNGRTKIYESIVRNELSNPAGIPESFHVLLQELRGLAIDMSLYDSKNKLVALTERDKELLTQE